VLLKGSSHMQLNRELMKTSTDTFLYTSAAEGQQPMEVLVNAEIRPMWCLGEFFSCLRLQLSGYSAV